MAVDGLDGAVRDGAGDLEPCPAQVALVRVLGAEPLGGGSWVGVVGVVCVEWMAGGLSISGHQLDTNTKHRKSRSLSLPPTD